MKQKLLVLMAVLMAAVTTAWAAVDETFSADGFEYKILTDEGDDRSVELTGVTAGYSGTYGNGTPVTHNSVVYKVTKIGASAFSGKSGFDFSGMDFSNVTEVGYQAFYNCSQITSLEALKLTNLETIGEDAFRLTSITEVNIGKKIKSIGKYAFYASSVQTINFNASENLVLNENALFTDYSTQAVTLNVLSGITEIKDGWLRNIRPGKGLTVNLPEGLTTIGAEAFRVCRIKEINIPSSVTSIGTDAFQGLQGKDLEHFVLTVKVDDLSSWINIDFGNLNSNPYYVLKSKVGTSYTTFDAKFKLKNSSTGEYEEISDIRIPEGITTLKSNTFAYIAANSIDLNEVTEIGQNCFNGASGITTLNINQKLTIGASAFKNCLTLTKIVYNTEEACTIGSDAFSGSGVTEFTFGENVKTIPANVCSGLTSLQNVEIPAGVTSIGAEAFSGCTSLIKITIGKDVATMGDFAFHNCTGIEEVVYNASNCTLGKDVNPFNNTGKYDVTALKIGPDVVSLPEGAFAGLKYKTLEIDPACQITTIGKNVFLESKIEEFRFPSTVTTVGVDAFKNSQIKKIYVDNLDTWCAISFANLAATPLNNGLEDGGQLYVKNSSGEYELVETLTFGDDVTVVKDYVFAGLRSATSINLNNVSTIGISAFENATGLTTLTLTGNLTIGASAFKNSSLQTINYNIPDLATFTSGAFRGSAITTVNICAGVKQIASGVFSGCDNLTTVNFLEGSEVTKIGGSAFKGCSALKSMSLPSTVTTLGSYAFSETGLTSFTVPASVTAIQSDCFRKCTDLTSVTIPATVASIGNWAFGECTGLTTINYNVPNLGYSNTSKELFYKSGNENTVLNVGEGVVALPEKLFDGCALKTVNLPASLKTIANDAFLNTNTTQGVTPVKYVSTVSYAGDVKGWQGITFGNLASNPLSRADGTIDFSIGGSTDVSSLVIPSDVTTLKENSFINTNFTSLDLGGVTEIGANCFKGCANLAVIEVGATPASLGEDAFSGISTSHVVIVPLENYFDYTKTDWYNLNLKPLAGTLALNDNMEYTIADALIGCTLSYTRTFPNDKWQALFLPFAMSYTDWGEKGQMAELTSVDNGVLEWTILEEGSQTEASKPYIFKPNAFEGEETERTETFSVSGTLASCKTKTDVKPLLKGTETESDYILSGTYETKKDMASTKAYALSAGKFYYTSDPTKTLKPYRIFLTVPSSVSKSQAPVRSRINGEDVTAIEGIMVNGQSSNGQSFNLSGHKVGKDYKGIVIVNGKKILKK